MDKMFPMMIDRPLKRTAVSGISYWFFAFLVIPAVLTAAVSDGQSQAYTVGLELGYHVLNFLVAVFFFRRYMKDNFMNVQIAPKKVLSTMGICAAVIIVLRVGLLRFFLHAEDFEIANLLLNQLPTVEMEFLLTPALLLSTEPVWGTICIVILAPVAISCLLYGCVFAMVCVDRPRLAYLATAGMFLLQHVAMIIAWHSWQEHLTLFLIQLPVHMIACWSYQKTDTIWTPIGVHMLANLVLSLDCMAQMGIL